MTQKAVHSPKVHLYIKFSLTRNVSEMKWKTFLPELTKEMRKKLRADMNPKPMRTEM